MRPFRLAAIGVALLSGAAYAQTTVTHEITNEPVETVITRSPAGTVVTRWPAAPGPVVSGAAPLSYAPAAAETLGSEPMRAPPTAFVPVIRPVPVIRTVPPAALTAPVVAQTEIAVPPGDVATTVRGTPAAHPPSAHRKLARSGQPRSGHHGPHMAASRAAARRSAAAPLALAPAERRIVYRTIAQQAMLPAGVPVGAAPAPAVPAVTWTTTSLIPPILQPFTPPILNPPIPVVAQTEMVAAPPVATYYAPESPYAANAAAGYSVSYLVGSQLPLTVPLVGVPQAVAAQVPAVARYSYAVVDNRVLLVDPASGIVVADVTP